MRIKFSKQLDRLEIRTKKRLVFVSCDHLPGSCYIFPTVRVDISRAYGEKSLWLMFLCAFMLIDILKIKD